MLRNANILPALLGVVRSAEFGALPCRKPAGQVHRGSGLSYPALVRSNHDYHDISAYLNALAFGHSDVCVRKSPLRDSLPP
jgi:hypothetical protein